MASYRTTQFCSLPRIHGAGEMVMFRGWPKEELGLEPLDDEAKAIREFYVAHKNGGALPDGPFRDGVLYLPLLGLPLWKLGASYGEIEKRSADPIMRRALGHFVMGADRFLLCNFRSDRWPEADVVALNEQARLVAQYAAAHPEAVRQGERAWDDERHCVVEPEPVAA